MLITLAMWSVWISWIVPVAAALLWASGLSVAARGTAQEAVYARLSEVMVMGAGSVAVVSLAVVAWIYYNRLKEMKRKGERRKKPRSCSSRNLARFFGISVHQMRQVRRQYSFVNVVLAGGKLRLPPVRAKPVVPAPPVPQPGVAYGEQQPGYAYAQ